MIETGNEHGHSHRSIPDDWKLIRLHDACTKIGSGSTPRGGKEVYVKSGTALIRSQNVYNNSFDSDGLTFVDEDTAKEMESVEVREGDVLLNITGDSVARCCTVPKGILPARVNQHVSIIRTKTDVLDSDFLRFFLTSPRMQSHLLSLAESGGTRNALTKSMIEDLFIPTPGLGVQQAIVALLSSFDSKIELNHQMNETLEGLARATFEHSFIDFEFPDELGKPYKSSGGKLIYNEKSGTRIPARWDVKPIDEVATFLNGLALQKYPLDEVETGLPVIKIRELKQGVTESSDMASSKIPERYIVDDGDLLFSWSGSLEAVVWTSGKGALNQHLFKVTSRLPLWYCYQWIRRYLPQYRRIAEGKATTMGHIQRVHLSDSMVLVPDDPAIRAMDKVLGPLFERQVQLGVESRRLSQARDLLLPKLMSGKVRVPIEA